MQYFDLGKSIDDAVKQYVKNFLEYKDYIDLDEYVATDNLGEVIEKLIIVHIRTWMLEDAIQAATTDEEIAELKRKIDICFKVKRPRLVEAVNKIVDDAILYEKSLREDSVKLYKGVE